MHQRAGAGRGGFATGAARRRADSFPCPARPSGLYSTPPPSACAPPPAPLRDPAQPRPEPPPRPGKRRRRGPATARPALPSARAATWRGADWPGPARPRALSSGPDQTRTRTCFGPGRPPPPPNAAPRPAPPRRGTPQAQGGRARTRHQAPKWQKTIHI